MENSQTLATESFSHSWLTNRKPQYSFDNHDNQLFHFDFPLASPQTAAVHADQIFSGGQFMPVYIHRSEFTTTKYFKSAPPSPIVPSRKFVPRKEAWGKSWRRFFGILKPLIRCSRKSNRVDDFDGAEIEASSKIAKSLNSSPRRISPSSSSYCSNNSRSCDVDSSIREAILYCKKSIES